MNLSARLRVAGYGYVFDVTHVCSTGHALRIAPTKSAPIGNVGLCFMHHEGRRFASAYGNSLLMWHDHHGLAFQADLDDWDLLSGIADGRYNRVSVNHDGRRYGRPILENGREVELITLPSISEISICPEGACPGAVAWLADAAPETMAPAIQEARRQWIVGQQAKQLQSRAACVPQRVAASALKPTFQVSVPASVARVLDLHSPIGQARAAQTVKRKQVAERLLATGRVAIMGV